MIGGHDAGLAVARNVGAIDEIHHGVIAAELKHESFPGPFGLVVRQAAGATDNRRDIGHPRRAGRQAGADKCRFAIFGQPLLRQTHQGDHALISFPRIGAETPYFLSLGGHGFYWFRLEGTTRRPVRYGIEDTAI